MEIHGAWLFTHEFMSPLSNLTDEYGGSFENRIRLTLEVLEAVQSEWPRVAFICANFSQRLGGRRLGHRGIGATCESTKEKGVDLIVSSGGGVSHQLR
jgi:2,4-dienoyl-CoA reductase-like NADH-dependent reductase (Old Yellow Enzyme family)